MVKQMAGHGPDDEVVELGVAERTRNDEVSAAVISFVEQDIPDGYLRVLPMGNRTIDLMAI